MDRRLLPETGAVHTAGFMDTFKQTVLVNCLTMTRGKGPYQGHRQAKYLILDSFRAGIAKLVVSKASFQWHPQVSFRSKKREDEHI